MMVQWAGGIASSWGRRRDFGSTSRSNLILEGVFQHYRPMDERIYLRPGGRLAFSGLEQSEQPMAVQIKEYDVVARGEIAVLYDGPVIPMAGLGLGLVGRRIKLATDDSFESNGDPVSSFDFMPEFYGKLGLGVPIAGGAVVVEPNVGYRFVIGDDREGVLFGLDVTVGFGAKPRE
jgi:hypothetical protein